MLRRMIPPGAILAAALLAVVAWKPQDPPALIPHTPVLSTEHTFTLSGEAVLSGGSVGIDLPPGFEEWAKGGTVRVQLTCKDSWSPLWADSVAGNRLTVRTTADGSKSQAFWWEVRAVLSTSLEESVLGRPPQK